jgi:hypothetical protein
VGGDDRINQLRPDRTHSPESIVLVRSDEWRITPATSAARMAARRRVVLIVDPALDFPSEINPKLPPLLTPSSRLSRLRRRSELRQTDGSD